MCPTTEPHRASTDQAEATPPHPFPRPLRRPLLHSRWTGELLALLGTMPDAVLAARLGLHASAVFFARARRGIPAYKPRPPIELTPEQIAQLGTRSDAELARRWDLATSTVRKKRLSLGIPVHRPTRAAALASSRSPTTPVDAAAPPAEASPSVSA